MATIKEKFKNLELDLFHQDGLRLSTMTNFPIAIFVYPPEEEIKLREELQTLSNKLTSSGWKIKELSLFEILINKLKTEQGEDILEWIIEKEKKQYLKNQNFEESLHHLKEIIITDIESENGIVQDIKREIQEFASTVSNRQGIVFITRASSLYPFYRTSNLLHYLTESISIPVLLFYPGEKTTDSSLSFMGVAEPYSNYRPRIY